MMQGLPLLCTAFPACQRGDQKSSVPTLDRNVASVVRIKADNMLVIHGDLCLNDFN